MRAGKRIFCGIMAGILVMMGPVNGYAGAGNSKIAESGRITAETAVGADPGPEITAPSAILMEASTGTVICEMSRETRRVSRRS